MSLQQRQHKASVEMQLIISSWFCEEDIGLKIGHRQNRKPYKYMPDKSLNTHTTFYFSE